MTSTTTIDLNMNTQIRNNRGPKNSVDDLFKMMLSSNPINFPAVFPAQEGDQHVKYGNSILTANYTRINPYAYMATTFKQVDSNMYILHWKLSRTWILLQKVWVQTHWWTLKTGPVLNITERLNLIIIEWKKILTTPRILSHTNSNVRSLQGKSIYSESGITRSGDRTIFMQFQINYTRQFGKHNVGGMFDVYAAWF